MTRDQVGDEAPNVQAAGMEWLQKIGDQYEKEKKEDLKDVLYYHTEDLQLPGGEYLDGEMGYLCAPFKARPSYGVSVSRREGDPKKGGLRC